MGQALSDVGPAVSNGCATCGQSTSLPAMSPLHVYAIGKVEARFPRLSIEKEYFQAVARLDTRGLTDAEIRHRVFSQREYRYISRRMCWTLSIGGVDAYVLAPHDSADLSLLIDALRAQPSATDIDVVIGSRGPVAPAEVCNGLTLPIVIFDQLYSFDEESLLASLPHPKEIHDEDFKRASKELLTRIMQLADNYGSLDTHRAINYLTVKYPPIYAKLAEAFAKDFSLVGVTATPSLLSGTRAIVDVIYNFRNRTTDFTEKYFVRVDTSEAFPFLLTKLAPYFDH